MTPGARMVDVSDKPVQKRTATAVGTLRLRPATVKAIRDGALEKGDALEVGRAAGILGVKATPALLPLCHPVPISGVTVEFSLGRDALNVSCTVSAEYKTGVEMDALVGASTALLTVWDMVKRLEKDEHGQYPATRIEDLRVEKKVKK